MKNGSPSRGQGSATVEKNLRASLRMAKNLQSHAEDHPIFPHSGQVETTRH